MMMTARVLAIAALGVMLAPPPIAAQGPARYREFELRSGLAAVSTLAGVPVSEARLLHQRPARLEDLAWRPSRWVVGSSATSTDPIDEAVFSFYNDQLFRIVVDYGYARTAGMTDADMIDAISAVYGPQSARASRPAAGGDLDADSGAPLARWGAASHAVVLYRMTYREAFRLVVTDPALAAQARTAAVQAVRLDEQEAPRREREREQRERDEGLAAAEKARAVNKKVFLP